MVSSTRGPSLRGRPRRGSSYNPDGPCALNRPIQKRTVARLIAQRLASSGTVRRWADSRIRWARWLTRPMACRVMRVSSTCSSVVGGLAYIILHLRRHHTMAKVQETFCYLLRPGVSDDRDRDAEGHPRRRDKPLHPKIDANF